MQINIEIKTGLRIGGVGEGTSGSGDASTMGGDAFRMGRWTLG